MDDNKNLKPKSNKRIKLVVLLIFICFLLFDSVNYINPGYVGILINRLTGKINQEPLTTGYKLKIPFVTEIIEYPFHMQTLILTQDIREGSPTNEEIITNSIEGQQISCDVSLSYTLEQDKIPSFYVSFRKPIEEVTHSFVKNSIRQAMQDVAGKMLITEILGSKKLFLIQTVETLLSEKLKPYGFIIRQFTLNQIRAPESVTKAIEQKNVMTQESLRAENQLLKVKYEAQQRVEVAKGKAKSIMVLAQSQAKANQLLNSSIDNTLVKYKSIEKWNGNLPTISYDKTNGKSLLIKEKGHKK